MLSPYRILDLTDGGSSIAGQILADLGADVVLIEPPGGVGTRRLGPFYKGSQDRNASLPFWSLNRNKRSVELDLDRETGREAFRGLLEGADVLIESQPLGFLEARGLGHEFLAVHYPELVVASITPFGLSGAKAHWVATDLTLTAASGQMFLTGDEDRPPLTSSVPQAYLNAGAEAAVGTLLALIARERDGAAQHVDVSVQTAMMMTTQSFVLSHDWNDHQLARMSGGLGLGDLRIRFVYPCKDGFVNVTFLFGHAIGPMTARMFQWMCEEGFVDEATRDKDWIRFGANVMRGDESLSELERVTQAIESFTRAHTKAELFEGSMRRRVLIVPVSDTSDLATSRQLEARSFWTPVEHPELGTTISYPGPFARFSETPIRYRRRPPRVGEHNAELLGAAQRRTRVRLLELDAPDHFHAQQGPHAHALEALPLEGVKVLDFTWVYAGPAATRYLADYGATVVKLESAIRVDALRVGQPFKDGKAGLERSAGFCSVNAGKLGLALNMAVPDAREVALRLVKWADVVVENFSPRAMKAWGMQYEQLRALNPELIMVSTCLNGQTGPESMLAGYGTMGAALAGFGFLTGWPDRNPAGPFLAYTDYVSPKFIVVSLLAALDHRRRTGQGQYLDLSQSECSIHFIASAALDYQVNGRVQRAIGNASPHYVPSGVYPAAGDDRWVALAAPDDAAWRALCAAVSHGWESDARFATLGERLAHREALDAEIAAWTTERTVGEIEEHLQAAGVPVHRVSTSADASEDPQLEARHHFVWVDHPVCGSVPVENSRFRLSRTPARVASAGPTLGQHNDEVLRHIVGLSDEEITELIIAGGLE